MKGVKPRNQLKSVLRHSYFEGPPQRPKQKRLYPRRSPTSKSPQKGPPVVAKRKSYQSSLRQKRTTAAKGSALRYGAARPNSHPPAAASKYESLNNTTAYRPGRLAQEKCSPAMTYAPQTLAGGRPGLGAAAARSVDDSDESWDDDDSDDDSSDSSQGGGGGGAFRSGGRSSSGNGNSRY